MWGKKEDSSQTAERSATAEERPASATPPPANTMPAPNTPAAPPISPRRAAAQIGKALNLKGEIHGSEDLYVDGEVEGKIELKGSRLTVGPQGRVNADVEARSITVLGHLKGNLQAEERIEIMKSGSLEGDLVTAAIIIEEGAVFRGSIDIVKSGPSETQAAKPVPAATTAKQQESSRTAAK